MIVWLLWIIKSFFEKCKTLMSTNKPIKILLFIHHPIKNMQGRLCKWSVLIFFQSSIYIVLISSVGALISQAIHNLVRPGSVWKIVSVIKPFLYGVSFPIFVCLFFCEFEFELFFFSGIESQDWWSGNETQTNLVNFF